VEDEGSDMPMSKKPTASDGGGSPSHLGTRDRSSVKPINASNLFRVILLG